MRFETLEDAQRAYDELGRSVDAMLAALKAHQLVLESLVATHPDYNRLQLQLSALSGGEVSENLLPDVVEEQRDYFEYLINSFQKIDKAPPPYTFPRSR